MAFSKSIARESLQKHAESSKESGCAVASEECETDGSFKIEVGEFVGAIEKGSTLQMPRVLIGRVYMNLGNKLELLWYKRTNTNAYKLCLNGNVWLESLSCLTKVDMLETEEQDNFRLVSKHSHIYRSVGGFASRK